MSLRIRMVTLHSATQFVCITMNHRSNLLNNHTHNEDQTEET